ncbi:MAG: Oxygen-independent coproporphyrinogen-III oxidase-like protein YqeR [Ignavibacteria bacterium]|nr:Oxygen-independent coproporphyrinogen-III oxidase-like protein YqeR [Ignavibacteria bacterium]
MSGIYVHIPFCRRRCNYCDFYFITNTKLLEEYLISLKKEMSIYSGKHRNQRFNSVYFGGGTPSILTAKDFYSVINELHKNFNIDSDSEISIEANPEDFTGVNFRDYHSSGISRISFGVQSFIDSELKFLSRQHTSSQAVKIIKLAGEFFENINLDLIYSLPEQKFFDLEYSLNTALSLGIKHISAYTLTFEEKTLLFKMLTDEIVKRNSSDTEGRFYRFVSDKLISSGFKHYEVSNFAINGFECRHNLKYWNFDCYLGLGPSSHSFMENERWNNVKSISGYINSLHKNILPIEEKYKPTIIQSKLEFIMLSLRSGGINFKKYEEKFKCNFIQEYSNSVSALTKNKYAINDGYKFSLNEDGYAIADEIIARYF